MEAKIIEHKNKRIMYIDHRGAKTEEEMLELLQKGVTMHREVGFPMGILANFENGFITKKFSEQAKELTKGQPGKKALVGITGIMKIIINGISLFAGHQDVKLFDTEEEAKEWLVI